jgi:hypothetical protein
LACSRLESRASLVILRLAHIAACLKMTNRRSGRSGAVKNMAPTAGRNTKSTAKAAKTALAETALAETAYAKTALVSTSPWHRRYLAWHYDLVALRVNPMPTSRAKQKRVR